MIDAGYRAVTFASPIRYGAQPVIDGLPSSFPPPRVHEEALAAAGLPNYSLPPADVPCPYKGLAPFELDGLRAAVRLYERVGMSQRWRIDDYQKPLPD